MDRPFTGDESAQAPANVLSDVRRVAGDLGSAPAETIGSGARGAAATPGRTARATWALATLVTACAVVASVLLPQ
jgi:hypothetical protein